MEVPVVREIAISDKAREIIDYALAQRPEQHAPLGLHHWLLALIECRPELCHTLAPSSRRSHRGAAAGLHPALPG